MTTLFDILNVNPAESVQPVQPAGIGGIAQTLAKVAGRGAQQAAGRDTRPTGQRVAEATQGVDPNDPASLIAAAQRLDAIGESQRAVALRQLAAQASLKQQEAEREASARTAIATEVAQYSPGLARATNLGNPEALEASVGLLADIEQASAEAALTPEGESDLTSSQFLAGGYALRTATANDIFQTIGDKFTGLGATWGNISPNMFQTEDRQTFEQAERNFINAVLRRESGATINPDEFVSARKQYIPLIGDSEAVVQQKALNRQIVISSLRQEAGEAYDRILKDVSLSMPRTTESEETVETQEVATETPIEVSYNQWNQVRQAEPTSGGQMGRRRGR